ncbi:MAG TPA: primosomal protein N' [Oscillospiraceae bacterium]|nr:primosomal protein N' [Oscillospiraceae bacterium]
MPDGSEKLDIAKVVVDKAAYGYDLPYSYHIPEQLADKIARGSRVLVPFGKGNRKRIGLVLEITTEQLELNKVKPIIGLYDEELLLTDELLELVCHLKETTFCTYFEAVKTVLPSGLNLNLTHRYMLGKASTEELTRDEQALSDMLFKATTQREFDSLLDCTVAPTKQIVVDGLLSKGVIVLIEGMKRKVGDETVQMVRLSEKYLSSEESFKLTAKQKQVVSMLEESESAAIKEICYICGITEVVVKNLIKNGVLDSFEYETYRSPNDIEQTGQSAEDIHLSDKQQEVYDGINSLLCQSKPDVALLRGVTGSGKTSIYIKLIDSCIKQGKQAMMLIPEIALTPQIVRQFTELFGKKVAILHSSLSLGQRVDEWKRLKNGEACIAVGTRSAVFAPLDNIGIIIMDEEGEHTYRSESSPRYHAREIAKLRCVNHNALLLLASATPSVDSYQFAITGRYKLFELGERYSDALLPEVFMVDMGQELTNGNTSSFSNVLIDEIADTLQAGEQVILLLNRRGYNTFISCMSCREPLVCPLCSIALTYHKRNGQVMCHYCGYTRPLENKCSKCASEFLKHTGAGTQKIEDELSQLFPSARVLRMDADTTYSRHAYEKGFSAFERGEYDIMVGTQMIAKGLNFPNVTLVGVLSVDKALYAGDYHSYERTFSLITQVVGRGGRGDKPGRAYIQTFTPEHYVLNLAAMQDYVGFFNQEAEIRHALLYPPFCDLCVVGFSSLVESRAQDASRIFLQMLKEVLEDDNIKLPIRALGPAKATLGKINSRFRYRLILKCRNTAKFRRVISELLVKSSKRKEFANVSIYVDLNGDIGL